VADITIEVTSPGTLTTWGESSWGSASWGQISGLNADQASANITIDSSVDLSTNLLNITTDSVSFIISGSVDLFTNLLIWLNYEVRPPANSKYIFLFEDGETYEGKLYISETHDNPTLTDNLIGEHIKAHLNWVIEKETIPNTTEVKNFLNQYSLC
jgi:hypothetical protein